jgi:hypothetical protein
MDSDPLAPRPESIVVAGTSPPHYLILCDALFEPQEKTQEESYKTN